MKRSWTLTHHEHALAKLIRAGIPLGTSSASKPTVTLEEWKGIAETAQQHRVAPLLYQSVKELGILNELPTNIVESLRGSFAETTIANHWAFEELGALLQIFERESIAVILLKGYALAATLYEGHGLRRVGDLDLLVRRPDFPRVRALLAGRGYALFFAELAKDFNSRYADEQAFWLGGDHPSQVDVHWHLAGFSNYRERVPIEWFWERTTPIPIADQPARIFSPNAQLLHLSAHFALHHQCTGLKWSYDLALLLTRYAHQIDWSEVLDAAHHFGWSQALQMSLDTVDQTWNVTVPLEIAARLRKAHASVGDRFVFAVTTARQRHAMVFLESLSAGAWTAKITYMLRHVFPSFSYMRERYRIKHGLLIPLYYFWRMSEGSYRLGQSVISVVARGR